jgi:Fur family ferric uptake transcriptional regulator
MDVGLATVYRVLTQFEQAGLLARQHFEDRKAGVRAQPGRATTTTSVCLQCGRVEEFYDGEIEKAARARSRARSGFELRGHSLALYADCTNPNCPHRPA